jgi:hypothetical protein
MSQGRLFLKGILLASLVAVAALMAAPAAAGAATTVGSPLTASFGPSTRTCSPACTDFNLDLPEPGAQATSPFTGVIVRWRMMGNAGSASFNLRVLHAEGGGQYTGAGTSSPEVPAGAGPSQFATRLAINVGDTIGINVPDGIPWMDGFTSVSGATLGTFFPALADGPPPQSPFSTFPNTETGFNADVEPDADRDVFGDETQDKCVGTAGTANGCPSTVTINKLKQKGDTKVKVTATVPGAGTLKVGSPSDKALAGKAAKSLKAVTRNLTVTTKQKVKMTLKLTKSAIGRLRDTGKLKLKVKAVYTPTGGPPGSQTKKKKLRS